MSAVGQIDPIQALAQQQMPMQTPQNVLDPVQALAIGQVSNMHYGPSNPLDDASKNWNGPAWMNPGGIPAAIISGVGNAASFNLGDPVSAAIAATAPSLYKGGSQAPDWSQRYSDNVKKARETSAYSQQQHPVVSTASGIAGGIMNPANLVGSAPATLASSVGRGAVMGGMYGLGGDVGSGKSAQDMAIDTGLGTATGAVLGGVTHGLGSLLKGATRGPDEQLLADEGVPLTMGQSLGGTAKTLEDASTHIPLLGNAIKARQADAVTGFNTATYNRVLEPLNISYDPKGPVGNEGIDTVGKIIGDAYDKAYDGATIAKTPTVLDGIDSATNEAANLLPKDKVAQIQSNINRLVTSKFDENGLLNSNDFQIAKNFFAEQSRAPATASLEDRAAAKAYGNVVDALKGGISETDPERGAMLDAADNAYMRFVRVSNAASSNAASVKGGLFTPSQLGASLRAADNSVRKGDFARGLAPMQDLAQAGQRVLPSSIPDSGTATRGLIEAAPWLLAGAATRPVETMGAGAALGAGTALYTSPGQSLARALLYGAPGARTAMAKVPQALLPGALSVLASPNTPAKRGKDQKGTSQ